MTTTTLPPRERLLSAVPEAAFDTLETACQQAGYSQAHPFAGLGLHSDDSLMGRLACAAFTGFYRLYCWLTELARSKPPR